MYKEELRKYEERLFKEMAQTKPFSWKRLVKAIELAGVCNAIAE